MNMLENGSFTFSQLPSNVTVGKYTSIAADCFFHDGGDEHLYTTNKKVVFTINWELPPDIRKIKIGNDVWIGRGVRVLSDVVIGDGAIIGAGAVIAKNVPPFAVVVGNPQQIVRFRFDEPTIKRLMNIRWWDWELKKIEEARQDMKDITIFLSKYG